MTDYQKQLELIFNHPVTKPEWYWETDALIFEDELEIFSFIEKLLPNIKTDLEPYSDDQIGLGLNYIFSSSCSNMAHDFKEAAVPYQQKIDSIHSLFYMFRDVFNPLCVPILSANSRKETTPLTFICYMFWDITPLSDWLKRNEEELSSFALSSLGNLEDLDLPTETLEFLKKQMPPPKTPTKTPEEIVSDIMQKYQSMDAETAGYFQAIALVMQQCLSLSNPACVESGLHGLGHLATFLPNIAEPIIDEFLEKTSHQNPALIGYAKAARTGMIQ